jgi:hypothetical protein
MNRDVDWIRERTNSDIIALVDELTFQIEVEDYKACRDGKGGGVS